MDVRNLSPEQIQEMLRSIGWGEPEPVKQPPQISPQDARELAKFEMRPSLITVLAGGVPPGNAIEKLSDQQRRWPRMVYCALRHPVSGKWATELDRPNRGYFHDENQYQMARMEYEQFAAQCQYVCKTEREYEEKLREGYRDSAAEALKFREDEAARIAQETAERHYRDSKMGEKAQEEVAAFEASHFGHQPEIPAQPVKRRGRPPKAKPVDPPAA